MAGALGITNGLVQKSGNIGHARFHQIVDLSALMQELGLLVHRFFKFLPSFRRGTR
jgi:copper homeostasis protein CutC